MATVDRAFQNVRTLFGTLRFFRHGWGLRQNRHAQWLSAIRNRTLPPPASPHIHWEPVWLPTLTLSLGTFLSPSAPFLPAESRHARVLYVPPAGTEPAHTAPLVLHLPATGDHGFLRRFATAAWWLRAHGVASLILEGPFYGARRPLGQRGALLDYVHQLPDLGRATIEEGVALLQHFRERGAARQAVVGVSQGGLHAAMVASVCQRAVPVVMAFAPHSAAPVFTEGVLAEAVDWQALAEEGGEDRVKDKLRRVLHVSDIANFPAREDAARHVLVFAKSDR